MLSLGSQPLPPINTCHWIHSIARRHHQIALGDYPGTMCPPSLPPTSISFAHTQPSCRLLMEDPTAVSLARRIRVLPSPGAWPELGWVVYSRVAQPYSGVQPNHPRLWCARPPLGPGRIAGPPARDSGVHRPRQEVTESKTCSGLTIAAPCRRQPRMVCVGRLPMRGADSERQPFARYVADDSPSCCIGGHGRPTAGERPG